MLEKYKSLIFSCDFGLDKIIERFKLWELYFRIPSPCYERKREFKNFKTN